MKEQKTNQYKLDKKGNLIETINYKDDLVIPHEDKKINIGKVEQITHQTIDKEKIKILYASIINQRSMAQAEYDKVIKGLDQVKDVVLDAFDDKQIKALHDAVKKGSKAMRKEVKPFSKYLAMQEQKKILIKQEPYFKKQLDALNDQVGQIEKLTGMKS